MADDDNPICAELLDYAETLLAGSGISSETILTLPLGSTPSPSADGPDPLPALWAGWSATTRQMGSTP